MSDHRCYEVGPTLAADERPWPLGWESQHYLDEFGNECTHEWELVLLAADGQRRVRVEEVVRCRECLVPRCGHSIDEDPCILERHHRGEHYLCSTFQASMRRLDAHVLPMIHAHNQGRDVSGWKAER